MLDRGLPLALLVTASWIGLIAAQQNAPPEPDAGSRGAPGAGAGVEAEPEAASADPTGTDPPGPDAPDAVEGGEAAAEAGPPEPPPDILEIGDGLYVLPYFGNATARVTPHGVVLVGDRLAQHRAEITRLLATVTDRRIAYELRTHRHGQDAGSAPVAPDAQRIAPARSGTLAPPGEQAAPPDIVFTARLSLFLGDAEVGLHRVGGGHTDGDAVVLFADRGTVHAGHLVVDGAPLIDYASGGSAEGWIESLDALLALEFDTVIPGEGPVLQKSDALAFRDRLVTLRTRIEQLVRRGVVKEDVADHLQTTDLGWPLDPTWDFVRETLPGLFDEVAGGP